MNNQFEQKHEQLFQNRNMKIQFKQIYALSIKADVWTINFNSYMNNQF